MITALLADLGGLLLLLTGGTSGIWSALAVFWAEGLATSITAAVRGGQRQSALSDDAWLAEAHAIVEGLASRPLASDESRLDRERDIARRRARLAQVEAVDRSTPAGAAAFQAARSAEDRLASGITGCVLIAFPVLQGVFLLLLAVVAPIFGAVLGVGGSLPAGAFEPGLGTPHPAVAGAAFPTIANPLLLLLSMAAVLVSGLWGLRRRTGVAEAEGQVRSGVARIFAMQAVLLLGGVLSIVVGWAGLAIGLAAGKLLLDVVAHRGKMAAR